MKTLRPTLGFLLSACAALLLSACADFKSVPVASSGTSGRTDADMGSIDMRNDPTKGLQLLNQ